MATANPFDLLGDDDAEEASLLIAAQQPKTEPKKAAAPSSKAAAQAKLPSKSLPPAQAAKEAKFESARGGRGGGRGNGRGRGAGGSYRDSTHNENSYGNRELSATQGEYDVDAGKSYERRGGYDGGYDGPRVPFRGGRRGGFSNGEFRVDHDRPRRPFDRRSGTGQGNEMKREGAGQGNWGTETDELAQNEMKQEGTGQGNWGTETDELAQVAEGGVAEVRVVEGEKGLKADMPSGEENAAADGDKEAAKNEVEKEKPEKKEMTLEEYEKVLEEKRKALQALKTEGRKVDTKEFESMQPLLNKKTNDDIFIQLSSVKDKKKELAEKEEKAKKSVSINEFLKPAEGERCFNPGGRGRGRGRGFRGGGVGGGSETSNVKVPYIEDPVQFPTLGGK